MPSVKINYNIQENLYYSKIERENNTRLVCIKITAQPLTKHVKWEHASLFYVGTDSHIGPSYQCPFGPTSPTMNYRCRERSYSWLQAGERMLEADFHRSDYVPSQARQRRTSVLHPHFLFLQENSRYCYET